MSSLPVSYALTSTALFLLVLALACTSPAGTRLDLRPRDGSLRAGHEVEVKAGPAVEFLEVDGTAVDATGLVLAPGRHAIRYRVRRHLRKVSDMLDGVFHIGECRLEIDALRGFDYEVRYAARQETGATRGPGLGAGAQAQRFRTQMVLENTVTGDLVPLPCELGFDCRRLKDGVRRSRFCVLD